MLRDLIKILTVAFPPAAAFSTERCAHDAFVDSQSSIEMCYKSEVSPWATKACQDFKHRQDCIIAGLSACFEDRHVETIERMDNILMRNVMEMVAKSLDNATATEMSAGFDSCVFLVTRAEAVAGREQEYFPWLQHVATDTNCSKHDVLALQKIRAANNTPNFFRERHAVSRKHALAPRSPSQEPCLPLG